MTKHRFVGPTACSTCVQWAYLNDPMPTQGPRRLLEQKRVVDLIAAGERRRLERYVIESGGATTADGRGARLQALIEDARGDRRSITLIVAAVNCLATTRATRDRILADVLAAGMAVEDWTGTLQPSAKTVALATAAAARSPPRRRRAGRAGRLHA